MSLQSTRLAFLLAIVVSFPISSSLAGDVFAQHEGHTPAVKKPKRKPAPKPRAKRANQRRSATSRSRAKTPNTPTTPATHIHTPGMVMPDAAASPEPKVVSPAPQHRHESPLPVPNNRESARPADASPVTHDPATHQQTPSQSQPHPHPPSHPSPSPAQPLHDSMDHSKTTESQPAATTAAGMNHSGAHAMGPLMVMSGDDMSIRVGSSETNLLPMGQMGSGTSWMPISSPNPMIHKQAGDWLLMMHYNVILGVNAQGGPRGVAKAESANWFMPMAFRKLGKGTLQLRGMFSLEPFTFPPGGSPLLFQTGETYKGQSIIDAQHPHDLFMELSAQYTYPLGERATWFTYVGYPGEPALGPTAFMHRVSASENPSAALSHHLQDSSHISFGVLTTGFTYRWFKLEGSVFNGREPDENRYDLEAHPWTSRSARLTFAPNKNWSMQISHGFLKDPEPSEPGDVRRTTASISYNRPFDRGNWATSLIWGRNHETHSGEIFNLNGYMAESTVRFLDKNYLYTRLELVDKNSILRDSDRLRLGISDHHPSFRIGAYTFGGVREIWESEKISVGVGSDVTFYSKPSQLDTIYGSNPASYRFFLRLRPGKMVM